MVSTKARLLKHDFPVHGMKFNFFFRVIDVVDFLVTKFPVDFSQQI